MSYPHGCARLLGGSCSYFVSPVQGHLQVWLELRGHIAPQILQRLHSVLRGLAEIDVPLGGRLLVTWRQQFCRATLLVMDLWRVGELSLDHDAFVRADPCRL